MADQVTATLALAAERFREYERHHRTEPDMNEVQRNREMAHICEMAAQSAQPPFQARIRPWMLATFGAAIADDELERGDRHLEEVLELLQSLNYPRERVYALARFVWGRPAGDPPQEVGGVMVTLAALCLVHGMDMHIEGERELARIWGMVEKIRAKQAAKPTGSALPVAMELSDEQLAEAAATTERYIADNLPNFGPLTASIIVKAVMEGQVPNLMFAP